MKAIQKLATICLAATASMTTSNSVARSEVLVTPESLNISGRYGSSESRFLLLQAEEEVSNLEIISLDLERVDGQQVVSADAIQADIPETQIQDGGAIKVLLTVDLSKASSNGQFQGMVLLKYADGQRLIPLTVNIQARPWWPALILLAGVLIGTTLSDYRNQGLNRDELVLAVGQLRTQIRTAQSLTEQTIPEPFVRRIQTYLIDVETSLVSQEWVKAKSQLALAQSIWNKWQREPENWLAELDYYTTLATEVNNIGEEIFYGRALQSNLKDVYRQIPDFKQPVEFQENLKNIGEKIDRFNDGENKIKLLFQDKKHFDDPEEQSNWELTVTDFRQQLHSLDPASSEAFEHWLTNVQTVTANFANSSKSVKPNEAEAMRSRAVQDAGATKVAPPPNITPIGLSKPAKVARWRLRLFNWSSRSVVIIFLSWAGFSELYVNQPTFGIQPLSDYFALLA